MSLYINQWSVYLDPEGCSQEFLLSNAGNEWLGWGEDCWQFEEGIDVGSVSSHYAGCFLWDCIEVQVLTGNIFLNWIRFCNKPPIWIWDSTIIRIKIRRTINPTNKKILVAFLSFLNWVSVLLFVFNLENSYYRSNCQNFIQDITKDPFIFSLKFSSEGELY